MTNDVLLTVSGLQSGPDLNTDGNEPVEVVTPAKYYFKNGKHYLLYDETDPDDRSVTHTTLKFTEDYLSVSHQGGTQALLVIESFKPKVTYYSTPFGTFHIRLDGRSVQVEETPDQIRVRAYYGLDINYEHVAECELVIGVTPR